ncbi:MAG: hypothetical protein ACKV2Q_13970 [Planctomycetaceae bacterium]
MMRGLVERLFHPEPLDQVFAKHAVRGYTRDLPFHTVAEVLSEVVFTIRPSVGAALVRESAQQLDPVILAMKVRRQRLLKKYRTRVLDGNHFAATEHRLEALRYDTAAPLPGQALVVFDADRRHATKRRTFGCSPTCPLARRTPAKWPNCIASAGRSSRCSRN